MGRTGIHRLRRMLYAAPAALLIAGLSVLMVSRSGPQPLMGAVLASTTAPASISITSGGCTGGGSSFCYSPESVTIAKGSTVTWTNESGAPHTVTSCTSTACSGAPANTGKNTFNVSIASTNGSVGSFTFTSAGLYTYYCQIHGYAAMHGAITVVAPPHIKSFSPTSGAPGTTVTILGTHLANATSVTFNGVSAVVTTDHARKIITTVPSGATTGHISVTTAGGTAVSSGVFTVT